MESRKILFVMNNSSSQKSIMSEAETLSALKADMRRAGIDYDNMTFYEGRTRTELKDDSSVLPTNVPVAARGTTPATTTNDLVFMLTTANKKIRSGALSSDRKAIFEEIKAKNLDKAVKAKFGRHATQCKTLDLQAFLAEFSASATVSIEGQEATTSVEAGPVVDVKARAILGKLLNLLIEDEGLYEDYSGLLDELQAVKEKDNSLSQSEINSLFGGWAQ